MPDERSSPAFGSSGFGIGRSDTPSRVANCQNYLPQMRSVTFIVFYAHDYNANNSKHDRGFAIQCYVRACSRPTINLSVCSIRAAAVTWRQARQST